MILLPNVFFFNALFVLGDKRTMRDKGSVCVCISSYLQTYFTSSCSLMSHAFFFCFCDIPTVYFLNWTSRLVFEFLMVCFFSHSAVTPEHQRGAPKEEFFITDVAYCEQAVIFLKQAKLAQNNSQRRKEDGTLPVSTKTLFPLILIFPQTGEVLKLTFQTGNFINVSWNGKTICKWGIKGKYGHMFPCLNFPHVYHAVLGKVRYIQYMMNTGNNPNIYIQLYIYYPCFASFCSLRL